MCLCRDAQGCGSSFSFYAEKIQAFESLSLPQGKIRLLLRRRTSRRERCHEALLGGKGANLAEMTRIGLPVPPGFTITTEVCTYYYDNKRTYPPQLAKQVDEALAKIEKVGRQEIRRHERIRSSFPSAPARAIPCPA